MDLKKRKRRRILLLAVCVTAAAAVAATDSRLLTRQYEIMTDRVTAPIRIALISDLHSCKYGEGQQELLEAVAAQAPDVVLLGGDIVDDEPRMPREHAYTAVRGLAERWPTYYVSGNHEYWSNEVETIKENISDCGAVLLEGDCLSLRIRGQTLLLGGIDDPAAGEAIWTSQVEQMERAVDPAFFSTLLTHRPERVETYQSTGFDLILAGHAHGGQWRVPGLINGLMAPNQGLFPAYAGGQYDLGGPTMIVSRGLARESTRIPRVCNRPELVIIDVMPLP